MSDQTNNIDPSCGCGDCCGMAHADECGQSFDTRNEYGYTCECECHEDNQ